MTEAVNLEFGGKTASKEVFAGVVELFHSLVPDGIQYRVLEDSLRHLAGIKLTRELIDETSWRIAGNVKRLKRRWAVPPWHVQRLPEWVPVQITSCRRVKNKYGKIGALFGFRILAGTPCPRMTFKWWSLRQCRFLAPDFGFHKPQFRDVHHVVRPFSAPEQFVLLRCYVLIDPVMSASEPVFSMPAFPGGVRDWNMEVIKKRLRVDLGYVCPRGFPNTFRCHLCPAGYVNCGAATHRHDWVKGLCNGCNNAEAWFDKELSNDLCVDCAITKAYKERK